MIYHVTVGRQSFEVELGSDGTRIDGEEVVVDLAHVDGTTVRSLLVDATSHRLVAHREPDGGWNIHLRGRRFRAEALDQRTRAIRELTGAATGPVGPRPVRAPMPGLMVKIEVEVGDIVEPGQGVAIVEAMKMENELRAESRGRVRAIPVVAGDTVEKDQILVDLEPVDSDDGAVT